MSDQREKFEAWQSDNNESLRAVERKEDGTYRFMPAATNWMTWQAATESAQAELAAEKEKVEKLVALLGKCIEGEFAVSDKYLVLDIEDAIASTKLDELKKGV